MKLPPALVYPFIVLGGLLFGRVRFGDASAVEAVKRSPIPILLIHGEDDRYVPCDMGRAIAAANPEKIDL